MQLTEVTVVFASISTCYVENCKARAHCKESVGFWYPKLHLQGSHSFVFHQIETATVFSCSVCFSLCARMYSVWILICSVDLLTKVVLLDLFCFVHRGMDTCLCWVFTLNIHTQLSVCMYVCHFEVLSLASVTILDKKKKSLCVWCPFSFVSQGLPKPLLFDDTSVLAQNVTVCIESLISSIPRGF